jgi:hypothetical protein
MHAEHVWGTPRAHPWWSRIGFTGGHGDLAIVFAAPWMVNQVGNFDASNFNNVSHMRECANSIRRSR